MVWYRCSIHGVDNMALLTAEQVAAFQARGFHVEKCDAPANLDERLAELLAGLLRATRSVP